MRLPPSGPNPMEVTTQSEEVDRRCRGRTTRKWFRMEESSSGLVASSVLSDTASASALRVCVSGLRGYNLTTDKCSVWGQRERRS